MPDGWINTHVGSNYLGVLLGFWVQLSGYSRVRYPDRPEEGVTYYLTGVIVLLEASYCADATPLQNLMETAPNNDGI